jgi:hypothetical protein
MGSTVAAAVVAHDGGALRVAAAATLVGLALLSKFWLKIPLLRETALRLGLVGDKDEQDAQHRSLRAHIYSADIERASKGAAAFGMARAWDAERGYRRLRRCAVILVPFLAAEYLPQRYFAAVVVVLVFESISGTWAAIDRSRRRPMVWLSMARVPVAVGLLVLAATDPFSEDPVALGAVSIDRALTTGWPILVALAAWGAASADDAAFRLRLWDAERRAGLTSPHRVIAWWTRWWPMVPSLRIVALVSFVYMLAIDIGASCDLPNPASAPRCSDRDLEGLRQHLAHLTQSGPMQALGGIALCVLGIALLSSLMGGTRRRRDAGEAVYRRAAGEVADYAYGMMHARLKPQVDAVVNYLEESEDLSPREFEARAAARRAQVVLARTMLNLQPSEHPEAASAADVLRMLSEKVTDANAWEVKDKAGNLSKYDPSDLTLIEFVVNDLVRNARQAQAPNPQLSISINDGPDARSRAMGRKWIRIAVHCDCPDGPALGGALRGLQPLRRRIELRGGSLTERSGHPHATIATWMLMDT